MLIEFRQMECYLSVGPTKPHRCFDPAARWEEPNELGYFPKVTRTFSGLSAHGAYCVSRDTGWADCLSCSLTTPDHFYLPFTKPLSLLTLQVCHLPRCRFLFTPKHLESMLKRCCRYYDSDADLSLLKDKQIVFLGYICELKKSLWN